MGLLKVLNALVQIVPSQAHEHVKDFPVLRAIA